MKRIITIETVKEAVEAAHAHFREEKGGKNADYIPYLKNVPSDLFGISVCLADGRSVTVGDTASASNRCRKSPPPSWR